jgi:hypothetical protein
MKLLRESPEKSDQTAVPEATQLSNELKSQLKDYNDEF